MSHQKICHVFLTCMFFYLNLLFRIMNFRCGISQTGDFLNGGAPNGLFGLGMDNVSVPSTLASKGLTADSFGMCFGPNGIGRIDFGDKGSPDQKVTPFNLEQLQ